MSSPEPSSHDSQARPASHGVRAFVRSAWILLAFQLAAAAAAVGVTGWAALQVQPLLAERDRLKKEIATDRALVSQLAADKARARAELAALEQRAAVLRKELQGARAATPVLSEAIRSFHAKNYADAIEKYDEAIALNPGDAYIQNLKSYSQFKTGDFIGASQTLARALQLNPDYEWGYFDLARYQCAAGSPQAALATLTEAARTRGDSIRSAVGFFLSKDGEFRRLCADIRDELEALAKPTAVG